MSELTPNMPMFDCDHGVTFQGQLRSIMEQQCGRVKLLFWNIFNQLLNCFQKKIQAGITI